jgi:hypothetical protein
MPDQIWFKTPSVLFASDTWSRFVPTNDMTTAEALNSVVRFSTYFSLILYFATGVGGYVMAIPIVMITTILLYNLFPNGKVIESFLAKDKSVKAKFTMPSDENPFMNVLLTEILDNPNRGDAAPNNRRDVKAELHKAFQHTSDLHMDTTDLFDQTQAMRTFHTIQSSMVPNDLEGFKTWLAKGYDEPDHSSAPLARKGKELNEGYVPAKGSMQLPNSTAKPAGTAPSSKPAAAGTKPTFLTTK